MLCKTLPLSELLTIGRNLPSSYLHECFELDDFQLKWRERPPYHFESNKRWIEFNIQNAGNIIPHGKLIIIRGEKYFTAELMYRMLYGNYNPDLTPLVDSKLKLCVLSTTTYLNVNNICSPYVYPETDRVVGRALVNNTPTYLGEFETIEDAFNKMREVEDKY